MLLFRRKKVNYEEPKYDELEDLSEEEDDEETESDEEEEEKTLKEKRRKAKADADAMLKAIGGKAKGGGGGVRVLECCLCSQIRYTSPFLLACLCT
jgi:hypothetical protein